MSLALMSQVWFCLLSAFGLGLSVGWLGKKLSVSQKRPTPLRRDEVLAQHEKILPKCVRSTRRLMPYALKWK